MQNILKDIIDSKRLEIDAQKKVIAESLLAKTVISGDGTFLRVLQKHGPKIIAEIKPKSPSAGTLRGDIAIDLIMSSYNKYACAISVLTDSKFFGGSMDLLSQVVKKSEHPILCKDFVLDTYQCILARRAGAQAVLLIVKILTDEELLLLARRISELGMTAVFEVQNEIELERIMHLNPEVILINNRNLDDFTISLDTTKNLSQLIPKDIVTISASGINSRENIDELLPYCSTFLIGSMLMRSTNLEIAFNSLLGLSGLLGSIDQLITQGRGE